MYESNSKFYHLPVDASNHKFKPIHAIGSHIWFFRRLRDINKDIGLFITKYRGVPFRKSEIIITLSLLLFLFVIPFLIGFYRALYGYAQYGLSAAQSWGLSWLIISSIFLILILSNFLYRYNITKMSIALHRNGLIIHRPLKKDLVIHWNEVTALYVIQEKSSQQAHSYRTIALIQTENNKRIALKESQVENLIHLVTQIKSSVYIHLLPRIMEKFQQGQVLSFGPLKIHKQFISIKPHSVGFIIKQKKWNDIDYITIKSGHMLLKIHSNRNIRIKISKIPNLEILLSLMNERTRAAI